MQVETDVYDAFGFDDDDDLLLAAVQKAEQEAQARLTTTTPIQFPSTEDDVDEFDDLPDEALNLAAEYAEKYSSTTTVSNVTITGDGRLTDYFATTSSSSRTTSTTRNHPPPINAPPPPQQHNALASTSAESSRAPFTIGGDIEELENPTPPPPPPVGTPCFHPYDREALPTWVYPINYPIRLYQYNIVQKCLFSNTLVALPTGLGKTFIAAVVMYNYWRWFPQSKIIFLAPSKPLVTQQIEACFKICGLPQSDTVEMTGSVKAEQRSVYWTSKRVFFLTPQTLQNDLESRRCPAEKIACIVFDEAHKATGNHSYAVIMRHILRRNTQFRVLALTATPGTKLESVQAVISSLCIASAQVRTEDSMDVQQYIHSKNIQRNVVKLDYTAGASGPVPLLANRFRREFFDPVLKELHRYHAIQSVDPENNSPYMLLQYQRFFSQNARNFNAAMKGKIYSLFTAAQAYSRAYDMLCQHGIGAFAQSLDAEMKNIQSSIANGEKVPNNKLKTFNNPHLKRLVEDVQRQQQDPGFIGHPKIETLLSVILQHLTNAPATGTRIMVFSTYRISVDEIVKVLSQHEPLIRCSIFVGQAGGKNGTKGLNQREQQEIITKFKNGELNVLVATSIGEEGLDIGEVDLIICYDAQTSPVRMLQRMGRTGRQRQGHCVMLMTESEEKKFRRARESYTRIQQIVTKGSSTLPFYKEDPSVLPERYRPVCRKERLTIGTFMRPSTGRKRGKGSAKIVNSDGTLTEDVAQEFLASFGDSNGLLYEDMQAVFDAYYPKDDVRERALKYLPRNTRLGPTHRVGHSQRTVRFVNHIAKMEKRILNDGCSDAGSSVSGILPSDTTEQLLLPRRTRPAPEIPENPVVSPTAPETLLIPGRLRRRLQARKERQEQLEEEQHHQTQRNRTEVSLLSQPRSPSPVATVPSKSPQRLSLESLENILDIDSALQDAVDFSAATQEESPGEEQSLVSNEGKGEGEDGAQDNENAVSLASSISLVDLDEYIRANGGEDVLRMLEDEQPEMTHEAQFPVTNVMHSPIQRNDRFDYDDYIMPVYPYEKKIARPKHSAFPIASFMTSLPKFNAVAEKMVEERELRIAGRSADSTRRILDMFNDLSQQRQSTPTFEDDFDPDALDALLKASEDTSQTIPDESASETIPANNSVNSNKHISANDEKMREISAMSSQKHASDINHVYTKQETNRQLYHEDVHSSHEQQNWRQYVNSQYEANCEQLGTATEREIQARAEIYGNDEEEVIELDLSFLENKIGDEQDFTIGEENASPILPPSSPPIVDGGSPSRPIHLSQLSPQSPVSPRRHSSNDPRSSSPFRPQFRNTNAPKTDFTDLMSQPVTAPARLRRARRTFDEMKSGDEEEGGKESENEDEMPVRKRRRNMHTSRNPFLDLEAEEGTDDEEMTQPKRRGNSREEDEDDEGDEREDLDRSSIMDSFIYDGSSELAPEQQGSSELAAPANPAKHFDIYRTSLLAPEVLQSRGITPVFNGNNCNGRKSWLDKVRTDMWMQAAEEDDVEVAVDEEEDEEEEADDSRMAYTSEIKEFNSDSDFASG